MRKWEPWLCRSPTFTYLIPSFFPEETRVSARHQIKGASSEA